MPIRQLTALHRLATALQYGVSSLAGTGGSGAGGRS